MSQCQCDKNFFLSSHEWMNISNYCFLKLMREEWNCLARSKIWPDQSFYEDLKKKKNIPSLYSIEIAIANVDFLKLLKVACLFSAHDILQCLWGCNLFLVNLILWHPSLSFQVFGFFNKFQSLRFFFHPRHTFSLSWVLSSIPLASHATHFE